MENHKFMTNLDKGKRVSETRDERVFNLGSLSACQVFSPCFKAPFLLVLIEYSLFLLPHNHVLLIYHCLLGASVASFPLTLRDHFILFVCSLTQAWCTRPGGPFRSWVAFKMDCFIMQRYHVQWFCKRIVYRGYLSQINYYYHWQLVDLID